DHGRGQGRCCAAHLAPWIRFHADGGRPGRSRSLTSLSGGNPVHPVLVGPQRLRRCSVQATSAASCCATICLVVSSLSTPFSSKRSLARATMTSGWFSTKAFRKTND